jgi:hypothetical protein
MELTGQYNTTPPTLTNGQIAPIQLTVDGKVKTDSSGGEGGGDASAANQVTEIAKLTSIESNTSTIAGKDFATRSNQNTQITSLSNIDGGITALNAKFPVALVFSNAGANSTLNIKASAGALYSFYCKNINAASRYIQFWNSATDATAGSNLIEFEVPTLSTLIIGSDFFLQNGLAFSTGIAFGFSSTSGTYTAATASDMRLVARYL